jgi:hypothetical protein
MTSNASRKSPYWLQSLWERKRAETLRRVTAAVRALEQQGKVVTLAAIRETIRELDGVSISTNTIHRNELAYNIYLSHAAVGPARKTPKGGPLSALQRTTPEAQRPALRAKIARLRRTSKDALIAKVMDLERTVEDQLKHENALREELLRITLKSPQRRS